MRFGVASEPSTILGHSVIADLKFRFEEKKYKNTKIIKIKERREKRVNLMRMRYS